ANRRCDRVGSMEEIITRFLRIVPARVACAVMDRIVPVKIVIGTRSVPPSVMRLERVMRPANACVGTGNDDRFSLEPERPNIRSVGVLDAWLDCRRCAGYAWPQRRLFDGTSLRQLIINPRVTLNTPYLRKRSQRVGGLPCALYPNSIHDIEGSMLDVTLAEPLQDRLLRAVRLFHQ